MPSSCHALSFDAPPCCGRPGHYEPSTLLPLLDCTPTQMKPCDERQGAHRRTFHFSLGFAFNATPTPPPYCSSQTPPVLPCFPLWQGSDVSDSDSFDAVWQVPSLLVPCSLRTPRRPSVTVLGWQPGCGSKVFLPRVSRLCAPRDDCSRAQPIS